MTDSAKYVKIVEWSEEDQCYVGSAAGTDLWRLSRGRRKAGVCRAVRECRRGHRAVSPRWQTATASDFWAGFGE